MNNFSINYDFNPSDSTAMDEFRNNSLKEQKMEAIKFREFSFSIPCNETALIDMAELIEKKAKAFNKVEYVENFDELKNKVLKKLDKPSNRAVFERLKNK